MHMLSEHDKRMYLTKERPKERECVGGCTLKQKDRRTTQQEAKQVMAKDVPVS